MTAFGMAPEGQRIAVERRERLERDVAGPDAPPEILSVKFDDLRATAEALADGVRISNDESKEKPFQRQC